MLSYFPIKEENLTVNGRDPSMCRDRRTFACPFAPREHCLRNKSDFFCMYSDLCVEFRSHSMYGKKENDTFDREICGKTYVEQLKNDADLYQ